MELKSRTEELINTVISVLPGWKFSIMPQAFGQTSDRYYRAQLIKDNIVRKVIIRQSWTSVKHEIETFIYRMVLPFYVRIRTPKLWATFVLVSDGSKWMVLEDLGDLMAQFDKSEDRQAFLQLLGRFHGYGMQLLKDESFSCGPLHRFDGEFIQYGGQFVSLEKWREILNRDLLFQEFHVEPWVFSLLEYLFHKLVKQPMTIIHGDINISNIILSENNVGLIDFERAYIGPPSLDLGYIAANIESPDELGAYRKGYMEISETDLSSNTLIEWVKVGRSYYCFYMICYYLEERMQGKDFGIGFRRRYYDTALEYLSQMQSDSQYWGGYT